MVMQIDVLLIVPSSEESNHNKHKLVGINIYHKNGLSRDKCF